MAGTADAYLGQALSGRYQLVSHLADGNFSHVFMATDLHSGADVAVKMLRLSTAGHPETLTEFRDEKKLLDALRKCRNVIRLLDSGTSIVNANLGDVTLPLPLNFHVMELADGTLSELLPYRQELDWQDKLLIFRGIVSGTHQMHIRQIVHRDLKSSNALIFTDSNRDPIAKVSDLGRSRDLTQPARFSVESYAAGRGDLSHAPPEHLWHLAKMDKMDLRRADIYLLGSVLYEMATGQSITSQMIPEWVTYTQRAAALSQQERESDLQNAIQDLKARHESALHVLAFHIPPAIRHFVIDLVRQMCNPRPAHRERRSRAERNNPTWGLQWVIHRVDIILKTLRNDPP